MMNYEWKDNDSTECSYYYNTEDGKIVGQVHKISHTKIWLSKIVLNNNEEQYLGQYISEDFAKKSIVEYWIIQERTLLE